MKLKQKILTSNINIRETSARAHTHTRVCMRKVMNLFNSPKTGRAPSSYKLFNSPKTGRTLKKKKGEKKQVNYVVGTSFPYFSNSGRLSLATAAA